MSLPIEQADFADVNNKKIWRKLEEIVAFMQKLCTYASIQRYMYLKSFPFS